MLEVLKKQVDEANQKLVEYGLVVLTWGNVSAIDRKRGLIVIKPSGVPYSSMTAADMVVLDLQGNKVEGRLNPSSDAPTHLALYNTFDQIGGITHTHAPWATAWAQAGRDIPAYGTTHADFVFGAVPCTRGLTQQEVENAYEYNTGAVICETVLESGMDVMSCPAVLVQRHGPFTWGKSADQSVENALILEEVAKMAARTERIAAGNAQLPGIEPYLLEKHYLRKHGKNAYYGQK